MLRNISENSQPLVDLIKAQKKNGWVWADKKNVPTRAEWKLLVLEDDYY